MRKKVVLAFSGGLDTSFCVPYLLDKGFDVYTLFVNTGGIDKHHELQIEKRAYELGASQHFTVNGKQKLWQDIVVPLVWANHLYQNKYPTLCADRYLIVEEAIKLCQSLGTQYIAHGCTGMGNDQVRFDLAISAHGNYQILSPIREIQKAHPQTRQYEIDFLQAKGFAVSVKQNRYSINENLLGVTISGCEIDEWKAPLLDTYVLCQPPAKVKQQPITLSLTFKHGMVTSINNQAMDGADIVQELNNVAAEYSIGRNIYTGDTIIGLKGRIVFEAPGLSLLQTAHKALEEVCLTSKQNDFKPLLAQQWTELVYKGFYFDPLYNTIREGLASLEKNVTGTVTLQLLPHQAIAIAIESQNTLTSKDAIYAQSASWGVEQATGFIQLYGQSTTTWASVHSYDSKEHP